jgi:hypothetical protein
MVGRRSVGGVPIFDETLVEFSRMQPERDASAPRGGPKKRTKHGYKRIATEKRRFNRDEFDSCVVIIRHRHRTYIIRPKLRSRRASTCTPAFFLACRLAPPLQRSLSLNTMPVALIVTATIDESRIKEFLIAIEIGACAHGSFHRVPHSFFTNFSNAYCIRMAGTSDRCRWQPQGGGLPAL